MSLSRTEVLLFTAQHVVSCAVETHGHRVLELLNDPSHAFLPVCDAQLSADGNSDDLPQAIVSKQNLAFVLLPAHMHEAPEQRQYLHVAKRVRASCQLVLGHEIRGSLHLKGNGDDPMEFISQECGTFFPVTDATVHCVEGDVLSNRVALVNKSFVSLLSIDRGKPNMDSLAADLLHELET